MNAVTVKSGRLRRGSPLAAGYDLFAAEAVTLWPQQRATIPTGVRLSLQPGYCGLIRDRSGLASHKGVTTLAGVIDADYDDEVCVVVLNTGKEPVFLAEGIRIAQLLFVAVSHEVAVEGDAVVEIGEDREGGFGSTGGY